MWTHAPRTEGKAEKIKRSWLREHSEDGKTLSSNSSTSAGVFIVSLLLLGTGSQEGLIGMVAPHGNQLSTGSESLHHLCAAALNGFDIPWWITATKWEEERGGGGDAREQETEREKSWRNSSPSTPLGRSVCWWSTVHFSGKCISALTPTRESLKPNEVPAEELLHPAGAAHLLLIIQWRSLKMLFDGDYGN